MEAKENKQIKKIIQKVFPYWYAELAILISCASAIVFMCNVNYTATIANEMAMMNSEYAGADPEQEIYKEQQSQFSINNPEQNEPISTAGEAIYETAQMCFVGNQIFNAMESVLLTDATFVTDVNGNMDWFNNTAQSEFKSLGSKSGICIVSLGLNDLDKANEYATSMNEWAMKNQEKSFVFVNVAPIDEALYTKTTNKQIQTFNAMMKDNLNYKWQVVDLYQYVTENNLQTKDGVTYPIGDLADIFSWLVDSVTNQIVDN